MTRSSHHLATDDSTSSSGDQTPVNDMASLAEKEPQDDLERAPNASSAKREDANNEGPYTTATDWSGPDDPEAAHNWSVAKKVYHSGVTAALSFVVTFGSSVYSPAIFKVADDFHISEEAAVLGLSLYVLGLGLGPLVSGGLSETYGRRVVYVYCTPIAFLFTMGAGLSRNLGSLLVCRFLAGAIGAGPLAVGAGTNADLWQPINRATGASIWILMPFLGPALGPASGGYISQYYSWRWTQWLFLIVGGVVYLLSLFQSETYKKVILKRRAKKYNLPPPHDPLPDGFARYKVLFNMICVKSIKMLFVEPICLCFSIYSAFTFGVLFAFFTAVTWTFRTVYHFSVGEAGLVFISIGVGSIVATGIFIIIDRTVYRRKVLIKARAGDMSPLPPEERLYASMLGAFLLPIGLFWFAWSAREDVHWIVPTIALGIFGAGNLLVFDTTATYLSDTYGPLGGASAMSANSFARYGTGAAFPLFAVQMFENLTIKWAGSLLAFVTVALLPIPFLFYKYGKMIRSRGSIPKSDA